MLTRRSPAAALGVALVAVVGTAAATLAIPGPAGPAALAGITALAVIWLAVVAVCALVAVRRADTATYRRLHAAGRPLYRRGEPAEFLDIPEVDR